ncbi:MAG: GspE/PulE family protein, partial [Pseudomonadota bacterium]
IFLVTGPTGSGKTTTLYAALTGLNSEERKIFTVEDPVEYNLPGISQIQVKPQIGLTFASALRSILRQDPDIVMLGEIRDSETAQISIQASLTGHLVLATVHTNDAVSSISRLLDMGVERFLLASTLRGVLAQRLVRKLCAKCSEPADLPAGILAQAGMAAGNSWHAARRPVGCAACNKTGYSGRTTIYEIVEFDGELQRLVAEDAAAPDILAAAQQRGAITLRRCGLQKVLAGETSLEEVLRVTGDQQAIEPT